MPGSTVVIWKHPKAINKSLADDIFFNYFSEKLRLGISFEVSVRPNFV